jgi:signal transduction histidine kinase
LVGYDDDWTVPDAPGRARYTRLPPGAYRLEVSAHVAGVPSTAATAVLPIIIESAWWQTQWFRVGFASGVLLLGGLAVRIWSYRRLRGRLAKLEHDSVLEQERARIAQNIHDDLGSGLSHISLLTQAADSGDGRAQLDKIYRTVSRLTQSMDEIVWAVNPKNDNLENFANYLVEFAQSFLTDAEIRCRVQLPETLPVRLVPAQFRHDLFLSCKEALNNVAKHARASEVTLELRVEAGRLVVILSDNGIGIAATEAAGGGIHGRAKNGLANMRARLAGLGGSCEIASSPDGTTVTFLTPLPATAPAA